MSMKAPKNFYNTVDQKKLGIDKIDAIEKKVDSIEGLPEVTSADEGKALMVNESGEWTPILPEVTEIEANPEEDYTSTLYKLQVGDTVYKVNEDKIDVSHIQKVKIVVNDNTGDTWNVGVRGIRFTNARNMSNYVYRGASITSSVAPHYGNINTLISNSPDYTRWRPENMPFDIVIDFGNYPIDLEEFNMIGFIPDTDAGISFGKIELYVMKEGSEEWELINDDITITYPTGLQTPGYYSIFEVDVYYYRKTLSSGSTSLEFESPLLSSTSPFIVMDNTSGLMSNSSLSYTASYANDKLTLTFTAQASDVDIAIYIIPM